MEVRNRILTLPALLAAILTVGVGGISAQEVGSASDLLLPPNAKAGECYARVWVEPEYRTLTERLLVKAEGEEIRVIPARFETVEERILLREPSTRIETVPATYEWVEERVLIKPASTRLESVPARYESESERVMVRPAYTTWKKGTGPIQKIDQATGEIMCLVEIPAEYETITKSVLKTPGTTREVEVPAEHKFVRKQVLKTPATTREVEVPAEWGTVPATKLVAAAREERTSVPARYETVTKTEMVSDGHLEWRSILCETNMTRGMVSGIQRALRDAGHNPGSIDGVVGRSTISAMNAFQRTKGLPVDQYLNMETIRALGLMN